MRGRFAYGSRRLAGWLLAAVLFAAAAGWAAGPLVEAARSVGPRDALPLAGTALAVAAALVLAAELLGLAMHLFPHDPPVSRGLMLRLVAVSALLNFLPLPRAGVWGRAAYLKARHGLSLRASLLSLSLVLTVSLAVFAVAAGSLLMVRGDDLVRIAVAAAGVGGLSIACAALPRIHARVRVPGGARLWAWPLLRGGDLALGATRLVLACGVVGVPLGFADALLLATGGLLGRLVGLTPNGLGISEAAVAGLAAALTPLDGGAVAAAAIVDRGVEALVVAAAAAASRPASLLHATPRG
ncbi:hypothetical protein [Phycisphaera mikurensis]|uniref:Uncharacterized protein n=1 Tax=Phycisphaera mikurensis (strain NBRC 102666 / KCTC 22515 / FYK2301M01) TaxID=1142394 RepID=I0IHM0_PHYMF|nr:hypothetical protein [Phycisphaera mikurensis]MBB6441003.1 hypothetical protein [Phycisphaera mikurensis]BAM04758.1 hypothetical protein PSMK_25990 [Phycisphaera mikurensis NBRC 102666]